MQVTRKTRKEASAMGEHRWQVAVCVQHRFPEGRGPWRCLNCSRTFREHPAINSKHDIKQLLDSVKRSQDAAKQRAKDGSILALKGVKSYKYDEDRGLLHIDSGVNRVVVGGRRISGRRTFAVSGDTPPNQVAFVGIDNNVNNPGDLEQQLDTTAANRSIKAFDGGFATITAAQTTPVKVVGQATWTEADNPGPKTFVVRRIGLLNANDNSLQSLYSLLGGTTPSNILELNFTGLASFTVRFQVEVTLSNQGT